MALRTDVARLKKLAWETMIRDALREVEALGAADSAVIEAVQGWRWDCNLMRDVERSRIDRFLDDFNRGLEIEPWVDSWPPSSLLSESPGADWLPRMMKLVEQGAPDIPPVELKWRMALSALIAKRPIDELEYFAQHGYFPSHTVEQGEAEERFIERFSTVVHRRQLPIPAQGSKHNVER